MSVPLAHDPAVPERDALLDEATVARRLSVARCVRVRATYRPGRRLRALHRVEHGRERFLVAATTPGRRGPRQDAELDASYWVYPHDRKLASLPVLAGPAPELVRALSRRWVASELVAWAPEKSATVRCLDASGDTIAFAKAYAEGGEAAARTHELVASRAAGLRVPRVLAYAAGHGVLFLEPVRGRPLDAHDPDDLRRLGVGLAVLHASSSAGLPRFDRFDAGRLVRAAETIGRARPDVADAAGRLAAELELRRPGDVGDALLHGDPHAKNALLADDRLALVDLDQAASGPAAAEVGSVLAWLRYRATTGEPEPALVGAFLAGYADAGALPAYDALSWHTAAALLVERALRAVHRVRVPGLLRLGAVLADAREVAG